MLAAEQDERRRIALFLHDGPVQSLAGVALMLDAAVDFVATRRHRAARRGAREGDERARARRSASCATCRSTSSRSFCATTASRRGERARARTAGSSTGSTIELDVVAAETLGERTQAALYQIVREALEGAIRRGPPNTFAVHVAGGRDTTTGVTIRDDAPGERRQASIEVLEERARTLGAALSVAHGEAARRCGWSSPRTPRSTEEPCGFSCRARDGRRHLLFVWKASGYELREQDGEPPAVGSEVECDGETMRVAKIAPSPLPGDHRQCAYLSRV